VAADLNRRLLSQMVSYDVASSICQTLARGHGRAQGQLILSGFQSDSTLRQRDIRARPPGRGLHSPTFRLNVSALCGIGGALRVCLGGAQGMLGGISGVSGGVYGVFLCTV